MQLSLASDAPQQCPLCRGSIEEARKTFRAKKRVKKVKLSSLRSDPVDREALCSKCASTASAPIWPATKRPTFTACSVSRQLAATSIRIRSTLLWFATRPRRCRRASGGTTISAGLRAAVDVLNGRAAHDVNPVTSILLLTDGQDPAALRSIDGIVCSAPKCTTVHAFGFGADHDAIVMSTLAQRGNGTFAFIETLHSIGFAFAAGLSTTCAVDIQAQIGTIAPNVSIACVQTNFKNTIASDARAATIELPDMFVGETRDIVFAVSVPKVGKKTDVTQLLRGTVTFATPHDATRRSVDSAALVLARPKSSDATVNLAVNAQHQRVLAATALEQAASLAAKNIDAARACLRGHQAVGRCRRAAPCRPAARPRGNVGAARRPVVDAQRRSGADALADELAHAAACRGVQLWPATGARLRLQRKTIELNGQLRGAVDSDSTAETSGSGTSTSTTTTQHVCMI
jgi:hypothetical protein